MSSYIVSFKYNPKSERRPSKVVTLQYKQRPTRSPSAKYESPLAVTPPSIASSPIAGTPAKTTPEGDVPEKLLPTTVRRATSSTPTPPPEESIETPSPTPIRTGETSETSEISEADYLSEHDTVQDIELKTQVVARRSPSKVHRSRKSVEEALKSLENYSDSYKSERSVGDKLGTVHNREVEEQWMGDVEVVCKRLYLLKEVYARIHTK